jgi:hypothetical protein
VEGGNRHVRLEASYLRDAVQLGYATTDYGNQGVTTDASVTWVGDATSAGGLYVGATRGRYENVLHIVAEDAEEARQKLIAAAERDRADRGLDVARQRAEADAVPVPRRDPAPRREPPPPEPQRPGAAAEQAIIERVQRQRAARERVLAPDDETTWRSTAELDAMATRIERQLASNLRAVREVPVMSDAERERENDADRQRAADARAEAAWHRGEIERIEARRAELVEQATADYFAAREAARAIAAGPGRLHRLAAAVEDAQSEHDALARRWSERQLPGTQWTDATVRHSAEEAVQRIVGPEVHQHAAATAESERAAVDFGQKVDRRERDHDSAVRTNEQVARRRAVIVRSADRERSSLAELREAREERAETMTPEEVATADATRDALLKDRERELRREHQRDQARHAPEVQPPTPHIERGGPSLGR